MLLVGSFDL